MKKHFVAIEKFTRVKSHKMIYFYLVVFLHRSKTKMIEMVVWDHFWFYYAMDINSILFFKMSWKSANMKNVQEISLHLTMTHHLYAFSGTSDSNNIGLIWRCLYDQCATDKKWMNQIEISLTNRSFDLTKYLMVIQNSIQNLNFRTIGWCE